MWIHPKQLVPGCVIQTDVMGKTNRPIVAKDTVVKEDHITILVKFRIEKVNVSTKLSYGAPFVPAELDEQEAVNKEKEEKSPTVNEEKTFVQLYTEAVREYKDVFERLQSGNSLDINQVRKFIIPLLNKIDKVGLDLLLLHKYSTKEDYFFHHSVSIAIISTFLARKLGYRNESIQVGLAGLLADSGMSKLNRSLFTKIGVLTYPEYEEIKKHPTYSYRLVEKVPSLTSGVKLAILQHHERIDGSGYPLGVTENKIHQFARIIAVSDMYHAMTSERIYQTRQSPFKVIEEIIQDQFNKFDHQVVQVFIDTLANFSIGMKVQLSNKKRAEIVYIEPNHPTRPIVKLQETGEIVTLKNYQDIYIEELLK